MNHAEAVTANCIEGTLRKNPGFRKLKDGAYIVKQGSTFVLITVVSLDADRAQMRCVAQLVKGVEMSAELAIELLQLNARLRFGAFAYAERASIVLLTHSLLGGETLDPEEVLTAVRDVARLADEHDDFIIARFGGQRMSDLLQASELGKLFQDVGGDAFA